MVLAVAVPAMMASLPFVARAALVALVLCAPALGPTAAAAQPPAIEYAYDERGRLVVVADQQGNVAVYAYDAVGNLLAIRRIDAADLPGAVAIGVVTPERGKPGTLVSIFGKGFGAGAGQNTVTFNGTPAALMGAAPNRLTVTVPPGATTGPIRVSAPLGVAISPSPFRVLGTIGIDPLSAAILPGGRQRFSALDDRGAPAAVLWSVNGVVGGEPALGTISAEGDFTAPGPAVAAPPAVTVTAISRDDTALSASATVTLLPPRPVFLAAAPLSVGPTPAALLIERSVTAALSVAIAERRAAFAAAVSVAPAGTASAFAVASAVSVVVDGGGVSTEP